MRHNDIIGGSKAASATSLSHNQLPSLELSFDFLPLSSNKELPKLGLLL